MQSHFFYHVSPDSNIKKLRPSGAKGQACKQGQAGIYLAPKMGDAIEWAVSHVVWKKKGWHNKRHDNNYYSQVAIYTIKIPKSLVKLCYYDNWWEREYFVPEQYMDQLGIVASKVYSKHDLCLVSSRNSAKRREIINNVYDVEKVAARLKRNVAAKAYLKLLEEYRQRLLDGFKPDTDTKDRIQKEFNRLVRQFMSFDDFLRPGKPIERVKDLEVCRAIESQMRAMLSTAA